MLKVLFYQAKIQEELRELFEQMIMPYINERKGVELKQYFLNINISEFENLLRETPFWSFPFLTIINQDANTVIITKRG